MNRTFNNETFYRLPKIAAELSAQCSFIIKYLDKYLAILQSGRTGHGESSDAR